MEVVSLAETKVDTKDLIARVRAMIRGERKYQTNEELGKHYGVTGTRIGQILTRDLAPAERKRKRKTKWPQKPKRQRGRHTCDKTKRVLVAVRWRLKANIYPSAAKMHKRLKCTQHSIAEACNRYLSDDEKLLMASLQGSGRKKNIAKKNGG